MIVCIFDPVGPTGRGCPNEPVMNFDYCVDHLNTPRGQQHMMDRVRSRRVVTQGDIERTIASKTQIQSRDYQTTALEKMNEALDRVLEWETLVATMLGRVDQSQWRYTDRAGTEQLRSEVTLYERAQDRTTRVLKDASKMAIQEKLVSLGKAQTDMIVRIIMSVVNDLGLDQSQFEAAKRIILEKLAEEANLSPKTTYFVKRELNTVDGEAI